MTYINHITLATGHCRRSPRDEVDDGALQALTPWLKNAIASGRIEPLPVQELSHCGAKAIKEVGLVVTVYGPRGPHTPGEPHRGDYLPLVTLGVAQRSREARDLWGHMAGHLKPGLEMPSTPWCAVAIHPTAAAFLDALKWLGDLERCIAWAWITRNPVSHLNHLHGR